MKIIVGVLMAASLVACGPKAKKNTTPDNKTGAMEMKNETGSTGGQGYGATTPANPPAGGGVDPCAGQ